MKRQMRVGAHIEVPEWKKTPQSMCYGTVTQITKNKVRVLFPIHKFVWLDKSQVKVIGYDF